VNLDPKTLVFLLKLDVFISRLVVLYLLSGTTMLDSLCLHIDDVCTSGSPFGGSALHFSSTY